MGIFINFESWDYNMASSGENQNSGAATDAVVAKAVYEATEWISVVNSVLKRMREDKVRRDFLNRKVPTQVLEASRHADIVGWDL